MSLGYERCLWRRSPMMKWFFEMECSAESVKRFKSLNWCGINKGFLKSFISRFLMKRQLKDFKRGFFALLAVIRSVRYKIRRCMHEGNVLPAEGSFLSAPMMQILKLSDKEFRISTKKPSLVSSGLNSKDCSWESMEWRAKTRFFKKFSVIMKHNLTFSFLFLVYFLFPCQ